MFTRLLVLLGLVSGFAAAPLAAEELPARGPIPFAAYDKDKSGAISAEEFYAVRGERMGQHAQQGLPMRGAANAPTFEQFDTNGDGQLTEAELRAGQAQQMRQHGPMGGQGPGAGGQGPGRGGQGQPGGQQGGPRGGQGPAGGAMTPPSFADHDTNGDGRITEQEFNDTRARRMGERAQQGGQLRNAGDAPRFSDLDSNGDGAISAEEFARHQGQRRPNQRP